MDKNRGNRTFKEACDWMLNHAKWTSREYKKTIAARLRSLLPYFSDKKMNAITSQDIKNALFGLLKKELSPSSVISTRVAMKLVFTKYLEREMPFVNIKEIISPEIVENGQEETGTISLKGQFVREDKLSKYIEMDFSGRFSALKKDVFLKLRKIRNGKSYLFRPVGGRMDEAEAEKIKKSLNKMLRVYKKPFFVEYHELPDIFVVKRKIENPIEEEVMKNA